MLRITTARDNETDFIVRLCGQFTAEYVSEIEDAIARERVRGERVRLDLSHVTFVDRPAMVFLCSAAGRSIAIENLPSYVRRWMEQERICGSTGSVPQRSPCGTD
jgi:anti-anti-sigma regulatory factor